MILGRIPILTTLVGSDRKRPLTRRLNPTQEFTEEKHRCFCMGAGRYDREIDSKIEVVMGFPLKYFLDAYKGYHQVQMAEEDEEKTAFYTDQVMSFNVSKKGNDFSADRERKRFSAANCPARLYISPQALGDCISAMSLVFAGLARMPSEVTMYPKNFPSVTLNEHFFGFSFMLILLRLLNVSAIKRFPRAQEDGPRPTGSNDSSPERNLVCIPSDIKRSSKCSTVSALRHLSRRLRRYFEAHPITVITDQPFKQILNKADISGRLAQYSVELVAYNITYEPRSAIKGQILADFINEMERLVLKVLGHA
ncbi:hypothetical protein Tco_1015391 [Tanacetum coccineum]|uniref:Reverse transcriptase RNase H-like domain-containing protein n=1 Tax=Tanacetum coccineum TaxID=301880 RepID=A0ABQ5FKS2_9ASTR